MGKKSLLAPTSKEDTGVEKKSEKEKKPLKTAGTAKKAAPKTAKKKTAKVAAAKKRVAGGKIAKKKSAPKPSPKKKKTPSSKAATSKSSVPKKVGKTAAGKKKTAVKKKAAPKKKVTAVSIKALLKRKFDFPVSGRKYPPPSGRKRDAKVSSPPFFVGETAEETERVRRLLFKKFDSVSGDVRDKAVEGMKPSDRETPKPEAETTFQTIGQKTNGEIVSDPFSTSEGEGLFPEEKKTMDPMQKMAVFGLGVLAVLLIMVMWASALNVGKYYVKQVDGQLEIWKGRFSPKGADKIFTLSSAPLPVEPKEAYSKEEAYTFIFEGIITDADALLDTDEMPDFEHIRSALASARPFAITKEMSGRLQRRLDRIDMMSLVYKADVLAGKGTVESLTRARESLEKAMELNLDEVEHGLIEQKINWVDQKLREAAE